MNPKVSVCFITYNHEEYVAQAIESVLVQETGFDIEVVIGEDCSMDGTRSIVRAYAARFPDRIRLNLQDENRGLLRNFLSTFQSCRGDYVALLDGDDYWTSPLKLEKQVRLLEENPDCSICFHDVEVLLPNGSLCEVNYTRPDHPPITTIERLFETNFIATCSAMLRRSARADIPEWYVGCPWEDWPLYLLFADRGRIAYIPEPMGVYRSHGRGLWSGLDAVTQLEMAIAFLEEMDGRLGFRYTADIEQSLASYRDDLALERRKRVAAPS